MTRKIILTPAEQREIEQEMKMSNSRLDFLLASLPPKMNRSGFLYSLWCGTIPILIATGWTAKELTGDLRHKGIKAAMAIAKAREAQHEEVAA